MYAKVIVDVPAKQTDRPFDYRVPAELAPWVAVGSRVGVPFGSRVLQGFVVGLVDRPDVPDVRKLKDIGSVLDSHPPLTEELVELARWMSRSYLCREITALQAMVPGALKAKYERLVSVAEHRPEELAFLVPEQLEAVRWVQAKGSVKLDDLVARYPALSGWIKEQTAGGLFRETKAIHDRLRVKTRLTVFVEKEPEELRLAAEELPVNAKRQKEVLAYLADHSEPVGLAELCEQLGTGAGTVKSLAEKGWLAIREEEVLRDPYAGRSFKRTEPMALTPEQQLAYTPIAEAIDRARHEVFLLRGVTGSGKTEVYLQAIQRCLDLGKEAIVLVPEISLTPQMVERFKGRFGERVAVLHSRLSQGERYDEWRKIASGQVSVAIGARSAVFAPFASLGLIILDEEHETSYKQEDAPKYHARDVAIRRAQSFGAAVVLGSATPSLESYARASGETAWQAGPSGEEDAFRRPFTLLTMDSRVEGRPLPPVRIVDMREELKEGNRSMFSRPLHQAIEDRLERKEQTVLLLNRRGYSTFVMCRTCGYTLTCEHCDISLTYHQNSRTVRCHYCGYAERQPELCPSCGSEHIRYFGTGTQRVEEELAKLFPGIRVIRMDVDTTSEKGAHEKLLGQFRDRQADVLLGTQMVAKGLDFPLVTLVGVIAADTVLNLPDFRAGERTFQLLTQVAGRAGRHELPGEVFVQTYTPEHYSVQCASRHDYLAFVGTELETRGMHGYPPYCRLILVTFAHEQVPLLVRTAEGFASRLKERAAASRGLQGAAAMEVLGPVASPISRIKDRYRFQCMIKYRGDARVTDWIREAAAAYDDLVRKENMQISIDVDPQLLM
ncbi:primosomal protein N' [Paenibacillus sp. J31TS4]|uniref:primosomal protein N' n=1 Tax=Paenibacillus sp. J31TS4 TaxID=2807195 RepID=UPI001B0A2184|nr:primosomal protein N' [Paenibacillus sp. J31TS4]GIP36732.1 primosomal protein N' [Paenibacillus sp. J31TS4]